MNLLIPGQNRIYKYRNLTMFADGGIINIISMNEKHKDKPVIQMTISDLKPRVAALLQHYKTLERDYLVKGIEKDEYIDTKDCLDKITAVMKDALYQGNPEDPKVMQSMLSDYRQDLRHKYTMVNFDKKAKCLQ